MESKDIFQCIMCGECCKGFGGTYINDNDIVNISSFIQCDPDEFKAKFCTLSGSRYVLAQSENDLCIFFDPEKSCTIHPVKPLMCRRWPFIEVIIKHPENWDIMAESCPGMKKNIPYKILTHIVSVEINKLSEQN